MIMLLMSTACVDKTEYVSPSQTKVDQKKTDDSSLTQRLQLLHSLLPHRLNVDASKAPLRGHFDEVWPLVAVWKDVTVKLSMVKQVLAVGKVPGPGGESRY